MPPKSWTAWPIPADIVPRTREQVGPIDEADMYTFKKQVSVKPSRELEDVLTACSLKFAKERFGEREWESPRLEPMGNLPPRKSVARLSRAPELSSGSHLPYNQSHELGYTGSGSPSQSHEKDLTLADPKDTTSTLFAADVEDDPAMPVLFSYPSENNQQPQNPVFSADDERSRELLYPTIRHTISKLNELLMALHHARQTSFKYGSDQTDSQTEGEQVYESKDESEGDSPARLQEPNSPRKRGRPSKMLIIPADGEESVINTSEAPTTSRRGRPRKTYIPLEGETNNEMLVRLARSNKQKLPFQSATTSRASSKHSKSSARRKKSSNPEIQSQRLTKLGVRDWSEVMGMAALVGFSPDVVSRATQRCATLFGEGMAINSLIQNPKTEWEADERVIYVPETISSLPGDSSSDSEADNAVKTRKASGLRHRSVRSRSVKVEDDKSDLEGTDEQELEENFWCSDPHCPRHEQGFSKKGNLISHLMNAHKLGGVDLEKALEDSDDEMVGGVHVDRFLKDVKVRQGWRGHDSVKRSRSQSRSKSRGRSAAEDMFDSE